MVTHENQLQVNGSTQTVTTTFYGLSTDEKPTDCGNGSCFIEMDTGKAFFFDAEGGEWVEVQSSGGGGGSSSQILNVNVAIEEVDDIMVATFDKTPSEIYNAFNSGLVYFIVLDSKIQITIANYLSDTDFFFSGGNQISGSPESNLLIFYTNSFYYSDGSIIYEYAEAVYNVSSLLLE